MKTYITALLSVLLFSCVTGGGVVDKSKLAEGYYNKGLAFLQEQNYERASVEFHRSIQTDNSFKQAYYSLGLISSFQDKLDDAERFFKKAIDLDENYSEAYNALGIVYSRRERWDDALKCFKKALENKLYESPHIAYVNMGNVYMTRKEYAKATEAYRDAKRFVNQDVIIYQLGMALFEAGRIGEAIGEYREGIAMAPQNASLHYGLALAFLKQGEKKSAIQEFKSAAALAPSSDIGVKANNYLKALKQ